MWGTLHEILPLTFEDVFEFETVLDHELSKLLLRASFKNSHDDFGGNGPPDVVIYLKVHISIQELIHEFCQTFHELADGMQCVNLLRHNNVDGVLESWLKCSLWLSDNIVERPQDLEILGDYGHI